MRSLQLTAPPFTTGDKSVDTSSVWSLTHGCGNTSPVTGAHLRDGGKGRCIVISARTKRNPLQLFLRIYLGSKRLNLQLAEVYLKTSV